MAVRTGIRQGFSTVTPYLVVPEVDRLVTFLRDTFGAEETYRSPGTGSAGGFHCEVRIGDSMLMCGGGGTYQGPSKPGMLHVYVPDADEVYRRALAAGAESVAEPEDKPYFERQAGVRDPTGCLWYMATRHPGAPRLEGMRSVTPFLVAPGALDLIEFLKRAFEAREIGIYKSPEGALVHAALWIGDAALEFGEGKALPSSFYLYVPDADAVYARAVEAGARPLFPPADQPYGDRIGGVEDPWGHTWYVGTPRARTS